MVHNPWWWRWRAGILGGKKPASPNIRFLDSFSPESPSHADGKDSEGWHLHKMKVWQFSTLFRILGSFKMWINRLSKFRYHEERLKILICSETTTNIGPRSWVHWIHQPFIDQYDANMMSVGLLKAFQHSGCHQRFDGTKQIANHRISHHTIYKMKASSFNFKMLSRPNEPYI